MSRRGGMRAPAGPPGGVTPPSGTPPAPLRRAAPDSFAGFRCAGPTARSEEFVLQNGSVRVGSAPGILQNGSVRDGRGPVVLQNGSVRKGTAVLRGERRSTRASRGRRYAAGDEACDARRDRATARYTAITTAVTAVSTT